MHYHFVRVLVIFTCLSPVFGDPAHGSFVYIRDQLLALRPAAVLLADRPDIPSEVRRKRRGCRAWRERCRIGDVTDISPFVDHGKCEITP